jgi:hypothetical protein
VLLQDFGDGVLEETLQAAFFNSDHAGNLHGGLPSGKRVPGR